MSALDAPGATPLDSDVDERPSRVDAPVASSPRRPFARDFRFRVRVFSREKPDPSRASDRPSLHSARPIADLPPPPFFLSRFNSKTRGLGAGRKLRNLRREQRWADKDFNKANLGSEWKKPFAGCSHAKGIVLEKLGIEAKQPNSAIRKCVRVQLIKNGKKIAAFVPRDGCLNFVDENDEVLIAGLGRKGHSVGDIPGVRFKVVKVAGVALSALFREKKEKPRT